MKKNRLMFLSFISCLMISGCGENENSANSFSQDTSTTSSIENSKLPEEQSKLLSMDNYFSGVKVGYTKDNFVDSNGTTISFVDALDRELDVLVEDLLYRLTYIYGGHGVNQQDLLTNRVDNDSKNFDYYYNSVQASTSASNMLVDINETFDSITDVNLNDKNDVLKAFQKSIVLGNEDNVFYSKTRLNIIGAIEGYSGKMVYDVGTYSMSKDESKAWVMSIKDSTYDNMKNEYKDTIKLGISKLFGADNNASTYSKELLSNIKSFNVNDYKEDISNYVLNNIIGSSLVSIDDGYYNKWISNYGGLINSESITNINRSQDLDLKQLRCYKGYSIVIPGLVEKIISNTFGSTNISLYPSINTKAVKVQSTYNVSVNENTTEIVLMPKANTKLTKLSFELEGNKDETISLSYDVVLNGTKTSATKQVNLSTSKQVVELELNGTLGAYNGNSNSYTNNNLFNNTDLEDNHGDNYIIFNLEGLNQSFNLTFAGMYNK